jgi:hypothetical protein
MREGRRGEKGGGREKGEGRRGRREGEEEGTLFSFFGNSSSASRSGTGHTKHVASEFSGTTSIFFGVRRISGDFADLIFSEVSDLFKMDL